MDQHTNNIIDIISQQWAQNLATAKRKIAELTEENRLLKEENDRLIEELNSNTE